MHYKLNQINHLFYNMRISLLLLLLFTIFVGSGCKKNYSQIYNAPQGQAATIYPQLLLDSTLSVFVAAVNRVPGLKDELSSSGLFTVMAPNNAAFAKYFASSTQYKKLDDIPIPVLTQMIKYHILKWMLFQGNFISPSADPTLNLDIYKYETRAVASYFDPTLKKGVFYPSKMIQVYTPRFFSYYNVTSQDYTDVFGPTSVVNTQTQMNVMGATVIKKDIASGNGALHIIDRVLEPVYNIAQELENNTEYVDYNRLLKRRFLTYSYNAAGTKAQGNNGDVNGDGVVDSLFTRSYLTEPNLDNENPILATKSQSFTIFVPSSTSFKDYLNTKLLANFYNIEDSIPTHTLLLLYKSHLVSTMDWPSKVTSGLTSNYTGDKVSLSRSDIKSIKMTSNGLMYTTNKVIEPLSFAAIPGPAFFSPTYWYFAEALIRTNLLSLLSSKDGQFTAFVPTNAAFLARGIYWTDHPVSGPAGFYRKVNTVETAVSIAELTNLVGNHIIMNNQISTSSMQGTTDKFYPTQNGTFVSTANSRVTGPERDTVITVTNPDILKSNGYFQGINKLIWYPDNLYNIVNAASTSLTAIPQINPQYAKFKELMSFAGINTADFINSTIVISGVTGTSAITSAITNRKFTLFVPSNEAIIAAQVAGKLPKTGTVTPNTVATDALRMQVISYLSYFFVPDKQAFTDGAITGTFPTRKIQTASPLVYAPLTISYVNGTLRLTSKAGEIATVDKAQPAKYPQNKFAKDGVIQVIDNAFTSQY
ncbi:MAG: hypothetical protein JWQ34_1536 [Mucilaginibacter sp.]|nr:hypothetical protein [Mucilaginibacter sp.]